MKFQKIAVCVKTTLCDREIAQKLFCKDFHLLDVAAQRMGEKFKEGVGFGQSMNSRFAECKDAFNEEYY